MTTSPESVWDDPALKAGGDYFSWKDKPVGTSIAGTIQNISRHTFDDGKAAAQLLLITDDGDEITLTASQVQVAIKMVELRPQVGDHIKVTLTQIEKRAGGRTLKHFDVDVTRKADQPKTEAPARQGFADDKPPF